MGCNHMYPFCVRVSFERIMLEIYCDQNFLVLILSGKHNSS